MLCSTFFFRFSPQDEEKYIVFSSCLWELLDTCPVCTQPCTVDILYKRGTMIAVEQQCNHCHYNRKWTSQPLLGGYSSWKSSPVSCHSVHWLLIYQGATGSGDDEHMCLEVQDFPRTLPVVPASYNMALLPGPTAGSDQTVARYARGPCAWR